MRNKFQFAVWLAALGISLAIASPCVAQRGRANGQQNRPPKQQDAPRQQRQQERQQRQQEKQAQREAQRNANRPPQANPERRGNNVNRPDAPNGPARANNNANRPPNSFAPPTRTVTPQERRKNEQQFDRLPPQQKQEMRDRTQAWRQLTPEQQSHIKNDVLPKWRQLPPDRQRAIRSRLNVLKNMPESARNQHLNDPNFTRGMNEEDKATLRDLSHLHVGGAPEPPNE